MLHLLSCVRIASVIHGIKTSEVVIKQSMLQVAQGSSFPSPKHLTKLQWGHPIRCAKYTGEAVKISNF